MQIVNASAAYLYAKANYPKFPDDWHISEHFTWNDVFKNELKSYGLPALQIFQTAVKASVEFEKIRHYLGDKAINIHCWFRSLLHNQAVAKQGYKPAAHSSHLYAMAIDFDVTGMTVVQVKTKLLEGIKKGILHIRIEKATTTWVHADIGNPYINDYHWGEV